MSAGGAVALRALDHEHADRALLRSVGGRRSPAATREKSAAPGITSCAQGQALGLWGSLAILGFHTFGFAALRDRFDAFCRLLPPTLPGL